MRKKKTEEPMQKTVKQILEEIMKSDVKNADILAKLQDCGMEKADINMKTVSYIFPNDCCWKPKLLKQNAQNNATRVIKSTRWWNFRLTCQLVY